jgi:hypothetical protein
MIHQAAWRCRAASARSWCGGSASTRRRSAKLWQRQQRCDSAALLQACQASSLLCSHKERDSVWLQGVQAHSTIVMLHVTREVLAFIHRLTA